MGLLGGSRRRRGATAAALFFFFAVVTAGFGVPAARASSPPDGPVGHAGRWITDATGRVLTVTGVNMVAKRPPYTPAGAGFDDADAKFLAANGFSAVRVGVLWQALEPRPGVFDDAYLASIERTVSDLGAHGIVSLLDFHQDMYSQEFQGEGAPSWAVDDDGLPDTPRAGFPGNYFGNAALQAAYGNFWDNAPVHGRGLQDWYAGAVAHVAAYFRGDPHVLGYDTYNEPDPGASIGTCARSCPGMDAKLTAFYARVAAAVRPVSPGALLFDEPWLTSDIGAPSGLGSASDNSNKDNSNKTGFSFHDYCPLDDLSTLLNVACPSSNDAVFANADSVSARTGDALLLTEFGATNDPGVLGSVVSEAEKNRVGWLQWSFCGCGDPTGSPDTEGLVGDPAKPPAGSNVNTAMLKALAVPNPELVAGTPGAYRYDPATRVFTLTYGTERADGTGRFPAGSASRVSVPAVQYPDGYTATASGAAVTRTSSGLTVTSDPGATEVSVTVKPVRPG